MREYETTYILDSAMTEADVQHSLDKVSEIISRHGGCIFRSQNLGRKTLAYRINKQSKGYYATLDYSADTRAVSEIERGFRLDEKVLRYLTVKLNDEVDVEFRKKQIIEEAEALAKAMEEAKNAEPRRDERSFDEGSVREGGYNA